jgi:hypothetical protein
MTKSVTQTGGCHCGAVGFELTGQARGIVNCHCGQCVTTHGHFAPYSNCARTDLHLTGEVHISWYQSSPVARRGFCSKCGSQLIWEELSSDTISIAAGAFDTPSGLKTIGNIFVADKPDYYEVTDGLPAFPQGDGGKL